MNDENLHLSDMLLGAFLMLAIIMLGADPVSAFVTLLLAAVAAGLIVAAIGRWATE